MIEIEASVGVTQLFEAIFGPVFGGYVAIVFAALAGSLWPLGNRLPDAQAACPNCKAAMFVLRLVLTATILTGIIAVYVEQQFGWKVGVSVAPIAFFIGAIGDNWMVLIDRLTDRIKALFKTSKDEDGGSQ